MAEMDELCFDNLDEFINDENKLVTYKWLSRSLSIHVNQAKQILYQFLVQQRNEKNNTNLSVTYFLSGLCQQNDSLVYKGQIVPEQDLESTKLNYTQLTSCHVYSVQKGKLKDSNSLYIADYDLTKEHLLDSNRFSSIKCPSAKLYKDEEVEEILQIKSTKKSPVKQKDEKISREAPVKDKNAKKQGGIAGMFAKSAKKQTDAKHSETATSCNEPPQKDVSRKTKKESKSAGVRDFFSKQVTPKSDHVPAPSQNSPNENKTKDGPKKTSTSEVPLNNNAKKGKKNMVDSDEEEPVQDKKRRRIRQISTDTSSSEDEMEVEEPVPSPPPPPAAPVDSDPDEIPPTPSPETTSMKPGSAQQQTQSNNTCGKIRKRKLVTKTYMDDEGVLITEKGYEDEWEDVVNEKDAMTNVTPDTEKTEVKTKKSPPVKKVSPAGRTSRKQTPLTNYFKKK